jgi:hypothetical protein
MNTIQRQEELNGRWYTWVLVDNSSAMMLEDDHQITEAEAEQKLLDWKSAQIVIEEVTDGSTN